MLVWTTYLLMYLCQLHGKYKIIEWENWENKPKKLIEKKEEKLKNCIKKINKKTRKINRSKTEKN